ncbi:MAG: hypothetical protein RL181_786 [Bacteroidota bacterium]|jgi:CcmD family protein
MKKNVLRSALLTVCTAAAATLHAHDSTPDFMQSMGKMYVVVAVVLAIFGGIISYMFFIDRKLTKLENQIKHHE